MEDGWREAGHRWNQDENQTNKLHQVSSVREATVDFPVQCFTLQVH